MDEVTPEISARVAQVAHWLRASKHLLFITGAGMSADSGLPTYRGVGGLYEDQTTDEDMPIEELLSGWMFRHRPDLTWKYLLQVEQAGRHAKPNRGHEILAALEAHPAFERVWVLTQNVDGFHRLAGSRNVMEIHGDIRQIRCTGCSYRADTTTYEFLSVPPRCSHCNSILRPNVVLFGEALQEEQLQKYHAQIPLGFDVVFSIGTTSVFPYIANPMQDAHLLGRRTVEINPRETEVSEYATVQLPLRAEVALEAIWREFSRCE